MRVFTDVAGAPTLHRSEAPPVMRPLPARRLSCSDRFIVASRSCCRPCGAVLRSAHPACGIDLDHNPPGAGALSIQYCSCMRRPTMTKPIPDKAEVALEYPDKLYIGTFERTARFDAHLDETGISLSLHRTGAADVRKTVHMHFHYALFAEILHDLAKTASSVPPADAAHRDDLREGAKALYRALDPRRNDKEVIARMTPEEEVLLLHVME